MKFDSKKISIIELREKLLMEELEKYVADITGERESILPYVRGGDGRYSESKTWEFIRELTECAYIYEEYCKENMRKECREDNWPEDETELYASASDWFSARAEEYLQNFLYCVIRIAEANPWRNTQGVSQTFGDFIRFSREHYEGLGRLYAAEAEAESYGDSYTGMKGIYGPASWLTHLFTGKYLSAQYEDWVKEEFRGYFSPQLKHVLKELDCEPHEVPRRMDEILGEEETDEEFEKICADIEADLFAKLTEKQRAEELVKRKEQEEKRRLAEEEKERIKREFCEQEQFVNRYLAFKNCHYFFEYENADSFEQTDFSLMHLVTDLSGVVKGMLRIFTECRGISRLQDDDAYFTAAALLRQSGKRFRKLVQS